MAPPSSPSGMHEMHADQLLVDQLVSRLATGRIRSVAFVVLDDASVTLPLYEAAIATARAGWKLGVEDVQYWLLTPEPEPPAGCGTAASSEGITFIGSTWP